MFSDGRSAAQLSCMVVLATAAILLAACNKSSPPPQEPVRPRDVAQIDMPLRLPAP